LAERACRLCGAREVEEDQSLRSSPIEVRAMSPRMTQHAGKLLVLACCFFSTQIRASALEPLHITVTIDQNGTPAPFSYILKWPATSANLAAIDVVDNEAKEIVQTISVPQKDVQLLHDKVVTTSEAR